MASKKVAAIALLALTIFAIGYALGASLFSAQPIGARVRVNAVHSLSLKDNNGQAMSVLDFGSADAGSTVTVSATVAYTSNDAQSRFLLVTTSALPTGFSFASPQHGASITPGNPMGVSFSLTTAPGVAAGEYSWDVFLSISDTPPSTTFTFAAAGDHSFDAVFNLTLDKLSRSNADFYLALGDLSYSAHEQQWCNSFKQRFPSIELITGNHDDGSAPGDISKYVQYCPFTLKSLGIGSDPNHAYGYEYYFDYPAASPIARFIQISPAISFTLPSLRETWNYTVGNAHYNFVRDAIENARASGIIWIIVTMHKDYISAGGHGNEIGSDLFNLLVEKKVDLILQGHSHNYQRSKQVAQSPSCPLVPVAYNSTCIVNDGSSGNYSRGAGSIWQIIGTFGRGLSKISTNLNWFARLNDTSHGFMLYKVSSQKITGQFWPSDTSFADSYSIIGPAPPTAAQVTSIAPRSHVTVTNRGRSVISNASELNISDSVGIGRGISAIEKGTDQMGKGWEMPRNLVPYGPSTARGRWLNCGFSRYSESVEYTPSGA